VLKDQRAATVPATRGKEEIASVTESVMSTAGFSVPARGWGVMSNYLRAQFARGRDA
jgi:hypothetical protein